MANRQKGEITLEAGGKTYALRLSINEICELEDELDLSINEIAGKLGDAEKVRIGFVRTVFRAALRGGGHDLTPAETGNLLSDLGMEGAMVALGDTFSASFPEADDGKNPPKTGPGGTGKTS